jgi:hypothetical protein
MKKAFAIAVTLVLVVGTGYAAEDLKSGPQAGERIPGPFHPLNVFNAEKATANGQKNCLVCQHGPNPVAMIFVREITPAVEALCQKLDAEVGKNKDARMGAFIVVLTDDEKTAETKLKALCESKGIKNVSLAIDNPAGPEKYNITKDADVTVILYNNQTVLCNKAFTKGAFTNECVEKVCTELPKLTK